MAAVTEEILQTLFTRECAFSCSYIILEHYSEIRDVQYFNQLFSECVQIQIQQNNCLRYIIIGIRQHNYDSGMRDAVISDQSLIARWRDAL